MPRYWVMAPVESKPPELFDKVWQFDLAEDVISIGWKQLGNVSQMTREELAKAVAAAYSDKPSQTKGLYTNMLWAFYHDMLPGDYVIARRGRKMLAGVGRIVTGAAYMPGRNPLVEHPGFIEVAWQDQPKDKSFPTIVFPMHTLAESSEEQFRGVVEGSGPSVTPLETHSDLEDPSEFVLEKYLEDFIVSNFATIFKEKLRVFEDADGNDGQQYGTDIGTIDILAVEPRSGSFVVIELKKGRPSDQVVGQVLRYMGWVKRNLCSSDQNVRGLVICHDHDPRLNYALEMTNNIDVRYYTVSFQLRENP
ncbi:MAG: endonuclease NucS domain-containing protein [Phycisphaerales bacterium]